MERGLTKYYTAVNKARQVKYAQWVGFDFTGESLVDVEGNITSFEVMSKELV